MLKSFIVVFFDYANERIGEFGCHAPSYEQMYAWSEKYAHCNNYVLVSVVEVKGVNYA